MCALVQAGVEGTNFYENYTGVLLPLSKLDFMAIPGKGGAVENWGLIQFDERRLLVNEVRRCSSDSEDCSMAALSAAACMLVDQNRWLLDELGCAAHTEWSAAQLHC